MSTKWIFKTKLTIDGSLNKLKDMLVERCFKQITAIDFFEKFSHVIKPSKFKVIFTLAVTFNWDIKQVDINNIFLNGVLHLKV